MLTKNFARYLTNTILGIKTVTHANNNSLSIITTVNDSPRTANPNNDFYIITALRNFANLGTDNSTSNESAQPIDGVTNNEGLYILAGSGTTDPTENDYTLENVVPLTHMSGSVNHTSDNCISISRTLRNDSTEDVVINEVGLYFRPVYYAGDEFRTTTLLAREVLTSPITMKPRESYTFTFML